MKTAMNVLLGAMLFLGARAATAPSIATNRPVAGRQPAAAKSLASLPLAAQASISAALGRDLPAYQIRSQSDGLQSTNAQHQLAADFTATGVAVRHGGESLRLALQSYGYAGDVTPVHNVAPTASANRVEYRRGPLTEWYVNGPAGLEQGFTLATPPSRASGQPASQPLQIALALSGDFAATVDQGQKSLTLTARDQHTTIQYAGLTATDATGTELPAWLELREGSTRGKQLLIEVADAAALYPIVIDPVFQLAKLTGSDAGFNAGFGFSVSISGNTVVAGAPGADHLRGAVYVFIKPASGWANMTQAAKLTASDGILFNDLGYSVSVSENTVIAGAPGYIQQQGAAYVFVKPAGGWASMTQTAKLTASDGSANDFFGRSVSVSGKTVAIGAPFAVIGSNQLQGAAYVFVRPERGWWNTTQTAKLTASDGGDNNNLGSSVSVSSNTVAAGAPLAKIGSHDGQGAAYVFVRPPRGWANMTQTAKLTASDGAVGDELGYSASISGKTVVAGAAFATIGSNQGQGAAYVFVKPANGWADITQIARLTASDDALSDGLGISVSTNGQAVVAGAPFTMIGSQVRQGAAFVFVRPASGWANMTQTAKLIASDGAAVDELGTSISVSGDTVLVGAPIATVGSNQYEGAAYVFEPASRPPQPPR